MNKMKRMSTIRHLLSLLVVLTLSSITSAQVHPLIQSERQSTERLIYKLNHQDLQKIYFQKKEVGEEVLHQFISSVKTSEPLPNLTRGNYLLVQATENKLDITGHTVDDFLYQVVPHEEFRLYLYRKSGEPITNAIVRRAGKRIRFDSETQTYNISKPKKEELIEVNNDGVFHYIELSDNSYYYTNNRSFFGKVGSLFKNSWQWFTGLFKSKEEATPYEGFIVFSKPKYKPNETVRFKGYLVNHKGKPYNKEVEVRLTGYTKEGDLDTLLTKLAPYRDGFYASEFKLDEKLKLDLDRSYRVELKPNEKGSISSWFSYEEYELGSIRFSSTLTKKELTRGDSLQLKVSVKDENELPLYGGRVQVRIQPGYGYPNQIEEGNFVFMPDLIWEKEFAMDHVAQLTLPLPVELIPQNITSSYRVEARYLGADNEMKHSSTTFTYYATPYRIHFAHQKGKLKITEHYKGKQHPSRAKLTCYGEENVVQSTQEVSLPYEFSMPWTAQRVVVETQKSKDSLVVGSYAGEILAHQFYVKEGEIHLTIKNPAELPCWYTIRRRNKNWIEKQALGDVSLTLPYNEKEPYALQLTYLVGGREERIFDHIPVENKKINIEVKTPQVVYPGKETTVDLRVADQKGKPVSGADVTAYAYTSKFDLRTPYLPQTSRIIQSKDFIDNNLKAKDTPRFNHRLALDMARWKTKLGLDEIEYYKFLYPNPVYRALVKSETGATEFAPYVLRNGRVEAVHLVYIDDQLYYSSLSDEIKPYSLPIYEGYHDVKLRTYYGEVVVNNLFVEPGAKNILAIDASGDQSSTYTTTVGRDSVQVNISMYDKKRREKLSSTELEDIRNNLFVVNTHLTTLSGNGFESTTPTYIEAGGQFHLLSKLEPVYSYSTYRENPKLVGPFPFTYRWRKQGRLGVLYSGETPVHTFALQGGYDYTVKKDYLEKSKWDESKLEKKRLYSLLQPTNFEQFAYTREQINREYKEQFNTRLSQLSGWVQEQEVDYSKGCRLTFMDRMDNGKASPVLIYLVPKEEGQKNYLFYGRTAHFAGLPQGELDVYLIYDQGVASHFTVDLQEKGMNYLSLKEAKPMPSKALAINEAYTLFFQTLKINMDAIRTPRYATGDMQVMVAGTYGNFSAKNKEAKIVTGVVVDEDGAPLSGASVEIEGANEGTVTDEEGFFSLSFHQKRGKISVNYLGYINEKVRASVGYHYVVRLKPQDELLEEVVTMGYAKSNKAISRVAGVQALPIVQEETMLIAGDSERSAATPLYIVDGLPQEGKVNLPEDEIESIEVLKGDQAKALYGERGVNGVVLITTKKRGMVDEEQGSQSLSLRRNFHDDAFWQPMLKTDSEGKASFTFTYPDDITSWNANFIAVGKRKAIDNEQLIINSFKAVAARLSLPRYLVRGDEAKGVGRVVNYLGDSLTVQRVYRVGEKEYSLPEVKLTQAHTDYIPLVAKDGDSLQVSYSLESETGFKDGEMHTIPLYEQGVVEKQGEFKLIRDQEVHTFETNPALGGTHLSIYQSSLDLFLADIDRVLAYEFENNDQLANQVDAWLAKKAIYQLQGKSFSEDKQVEKAIRKLVGNRNSEGLWGWWKERPTEAWITNRVVEALVAAGKAGYRIPVSTLELSGALEKELNKGIASLDYLVGTKQPVKSNLLRMLVTGYQLNSKIEVVNRYEILASPEKREKLTDKLLRFYAQAKLGMALRVDEAELLSYAKKNLLGSTYWPSNENEARFYCLPLTNELENSLLGYQTLIAIGANKEVEESARNYFFEKRSKNFWNSPLEAISVMKALLPSLLQEKPAVEAAGVIINGEEIHRFPYQQVFDTNNFKIQRKGNLPLFLSLYQEKWVSNPKEVSAGFTVSSSFVKNKEKQEQLEAGKSVNLEVELQLDSDADYLSLEIPIPAGCSYEEQFGIMPRWGEESHREYYKDRVVIFYRKLSAGKHRVVLSLLPRYSGTYRLNPAKVELYYFPTFYGREKMKAVSIE